MLTRRATWLGGTMFLILTLSLSGLVSAAEPPVTEPVVVLDTTATYEDLDGNGIDDDCQDAAPVVGDTTPATVAAELALVDLDGDGTVSQSEAAQSSRTGGKNCNHGGYVSWMAHQKHECAEEPVVEPTEADAVDLVVTTPPDAEPEAEVEACESDDEVITAAKKDKVAAAAAREASKAERSSLRDAAKAERAVARDAAKAERAVARDAAKAERSAARDAKHAERQAAKAARTNKGH